MAFLNYTFIITLLKNPFVVLFSVLLGLGIGIFSPTTGNILEPYGSVFMALLEMSLIPIIFCSIASSLSNLFSLSNQGVKTGRIVFLMLLVALSVSAISASLSYILDPASIFLTSDNIKIKEISTASSFLDRQLNASIIPPTDGGLSYFLQNSIPNNIFHSLSESKMLQIIVFSIILGVATAFIPQAERTKLQSFFQITLSLFQKIITTFTPWLPLAIICLMSGSISKIGVDMLLQMGGFILKVHAVFIVIFCASTLLIVHKSHYNIKQVITLFKDPIVMAFGTRSSILPIPSILKIFDESFSLNKSLPKLLVPLGAVLGRFGNISYLAILSVFIAGIYQVDFTPGLMLTIIILSVLGGLSTAGSTGILTLGALAIILDPLHLPLGAILPLLIAIDTIIEPMRTLTTVFTNCAATSLVTPKDTAP